jgi:fatty acid desaturase
VVGRDPEIAFPRPTPRIRVLAEFFGLLSARNEIVKIFRNMLGRPAAPQRNYQPEDTLRKSQFWSWVFILVLVAVAVWCIQIGSIEPALFVGLPSIYGKWLLMAYGITQHAGLAEDVVDHRLNTRTVHMNFVHRFLYLNMNYHLEHHIFPNVPYDALPRLHELVKEQLPPAHESVRDAWREAFRAMSEQRRDQTFYQSVKLPESAA